MRELADGALWPPPEFWSASGVCARKGLAGRAYATELRLLVGWRFELCDNGSITLDTIESWGNEHLRT